jgi:hypothetical protein
MRERSRIIFAVDAVSRRCASPSSLDCYGSISSDGFVQTSASPFSREGFAFRTGAIFPATICEWDRVRQAPSLGWCNRSSGMISALSLSLPTHG